MTSQALPLGPIVSGQSVLIVSYGPTGPQLLCSLQSGQRVNYYWETNFIGAQGLTVKPPVFTAFGSTTLSFNDQTNGGGLGLASDNVTIRNTFSPTPIQVIQTQFTPWFPPTLLLSGVSYSLNNSEGATLQIYSDKNLNERTPATSIYFLSVQWYGNCTSDGRYNVINDPSNSVANWYCIAADNAPFDYCNSVLRGAWTNLNDCQVGVNYSYCPNPKLCGTASCKGPCQAVYYDCSFNNNYTCQFNPLLYFEDYPWWKSTYFIGIVVGLVILITLLIILGLYLSRRKDVTKSS